MFHHFHHLHQNGATQSAPMCSLELKKRGGITKKCIVPVNLPRTDAIPAASHTPQICSRKCNKRVGWRLEQKSGDRMGWRKHEWKRFGRKLDRSWRGQLSIGNHRGCHNRFFKRVLGIILQVRNAFHICWPASIAGAYGHRYVSSLQTRDLADT